jgi:ABC-type branched-subunit amino acid transport system substrate-binding protein
MQSGSALRLAALGLVAVSLGTGCGTDKSGGDGGAAGADGVGVVKIGYVAELSGDYQSYGVPANEAIRLAVQQANEKGPFEVAGKPYKLEIVGKDDQSQPSLTAANTTAMVRDEGVRFVFGGIGKLSPLVLQVTNPAKALYFSSSSAAAAKSGTPEGKYLFTTIPGLGVRMQVAVDSLFDYYQDARKITLLGPTIVDNQTLFPEMRKRLTAAKPGVTVDQVDFAPDTTDFSSILTKLKRQQPDVVFIGSTTPEQLSALIQRAEALKAVKRWFAWGQNCANGANAGVTAPYVGDAQVGADLDHPQTDSARRFLEDFKAYTKQDSMPNLFTTTWVYDFVPMLVEAMKTAGTVTDTDKIAEALRGTTYTGLLGKISFDATNQSVYGFDVCQVLDGKTTVRHYEPSGQ